DGDYRLLRNEYKRNEFSSRITLILGASAIIFSVVGLTLSLQDTFYNIIAFLTLFHGILFLLREYYTRNTYMVISPDYADFHKLDKEAIRFYWDEVEAIFQYHRF